MRERAGRAGPPPALVAMGVSGCGKTALGQALAGEIGCRFIEGDDLQPPENVACMAAGLPLTDALRAGWLDAVGRAISDAAKAGDGSIAACSALKRIYRDRLRGWHGNIVFLHLAIDEETARRRVAGRTNHFMPASLVESQFATLEPPGADEDALALDGTMPVRELVGKVLAFLAARGERA